MLPSKPQICHWSRWFSQLVSPPSFAIVGGYHCGNLGDLALGNAVRHFAQEQGLRSGLQTIYNLHKWPPAKYSIVGGGAVGYSSCLKQLEQRYHEHPERVALLGVDFNDVDALAASKTFLQRVGFISCRSMEQAKAVSVSLDRSDVVSHADLAFGTPIIAPVHANSRRRGRLRIGINVVPLYSAWRGGEFVLDHSSLKERPDLRSRSEHLLSSYQEFLRYIVARLESSDVDIVHVPFTPQDGVFAAQVFAGTSVALRPYRTSVPAVEAEFALFDSFLTTRFHSLVFAMRAGIPVRPVCYATKCERLLESFGYAAENLIRPNEILDDPRMAAEKLLSEVGLFTADHDAVQKSSREVASIISRCIREMVQ